MNLINGNSKANIDQSINLPDYFSCRNCHGFKDWSYCQELRRENLCAKQMLATALDRGAITIHLTLPAGEVK